MESTEGCTRPRRIAPGVPTQTAEIVVIRPYLYGQICARWYFDPHWVQVFGQRSQLCPTWKHLEHRTLVVSRSGAGLIGV